MNQKRGWSSGRPAGSGFLTASTVADLNGDGHLDLIDTSGIDAVMTVALGSATGVFAEPIHPFVISQDPMGCNESLHLVG